MASSRARTDATHRSSPSSAAMVRLIESSSSLYSAVAVIESLIRRKISRAYDIRGDQCNIPASTVKWQRIAHLAGVMTLWTPAPSGDGPARRRCRSRLACSEPRAPSPLAGAARMPGRPGNFSLKTGDRQKRITSRAPSASASADGVARTRRMRIARG